MRPHLLPARGTAAHAAHALNDMLAEIVTGIRELQQRGDAGPSKQKVAVEEPLAVPLAVQHELPVSDAAPAKDGHSPKIVVPPAEPGMPTQLEVMPLENMMPMQQGHDSHSAQSPALRPQPGQPTVEQHQDTPTAFRPHAGNNNPEMPSVPDLRPELEAFARELAQQNEVTLRTLRQVTELCRQQQSRIDRLSEDVASLSSRTRVQAYRS